MCDQQPTGTDSGSHLIRALLSGLWPQRRPRPGPPGRGQTRGQSHHRCECQPEWLFGLVAVTCTSMEVYKGRSAFRSNTEFSLMQSETFETNCEAAITAFELATCRSLPRPVLPPPSAGAAGAPAPLPA